VLDSAAAPHVQLVESLWTMMPEIKVQATGEKEFLLRSIDSTAAARLIFAGPLASAPSIRLGSLTPFGGWIVRAGQPTPAPAIEVQQRADRVPVATVLKLGEQRVTIHVEGAERDETHWSIWVDSEQDGFVVRRVKDRLSIQFSDGRDETVELVASADVEARRREIVLAYEAAMREFPGVRDLTFYRYRVTMLALIMLALQEAVIGAARRFARSSVPVLRTIASFAWLSFGILAAFWYLR
jgi:hypothetical protein